MHFWNLQDPLLLECFVHSTAVNINPLTNNINLLTHDHLIFNLDVLPFLLISLRSMSEQNLLRSSGILYLSHEFPWVKTSSKDLSSSVFCQNCLTCAYNLLSKASNKLIIIIIIIIIITIIYPGSPLARSDFQWGPAK